VGSVVQHLRAHDHEPVLITAEEDADWTDVVGRHERIRLPLHTSARTARAVRNFLCDIRPTDRLFYIGVDVACGTYGRDALSRLILVQGVRRAGGRSSIVSLSFDETPDPLALRLMRGLPPDVPLVLRDPESRTRAEHRLRRPLPLGAADGTPDQPGLRAEVLTEEPIPDEELRSLAAAAGANRPFVLPPRHLDVDHRAGQRNRPDCSAYRSSQR
jgi:hypothetical protein